MIDDSLPINDNGPITWHCDGRLFVCTRFVTIKPGEYLAIGKVCDPVTCLPTGDLFCLFERDGEVEQAWVSPPIVWERWLSMVNEVLEDAP